MREFTTTQVHHLPTSIYNSVWRWQYMKRKAVIRHFKTTIYILMKKTPKLYSDEHL